MAGFGGGYKNVCDFLRMNLYEGGFFGQHIHIFKTADFTIFMMGMYRIYSFSRKIIAMPLIILMAVQRFNQQRVHQQQHEKKCDYDFIFSRANIGLVKR
ncbi:MAG: hypothetical protein IPH20_14825 [Bacteroidales bacterium]|nr:hypothetical protein [Bacteroidales bacterium]